MDASLLTIIIAVISALTGAGVLGFVQFLIQRKDKTNEKLDKILKNQDDLELTLCRLQLLNLIQHDGSQHELMIVAERYFKDLEGDWYMTPIFCRWLEAHGIDKPAWFKGVA